jgi:diguanylate cyclase (GGDEF)-like protein
MQGEENKPASAAWLLGHEPAMRLRLAQAGLATLLMTACVGILIYAALHAGTPRWAVALWALLSEGLALAMFLAIRLGWSLRRPDPSLTREQIVCALVAGSSAYPLAGELRALVLPIVLVILSFGMFQLKPGESTRLSWLALALLSTAMLFGMLVWPGSFAPWREFGHWLMAAFTVPAVAVLAGRMSTIRHRLRQQREQLNAALARIEELATRDVLTGLHNRRHGEALLVQALQRQERSGQPFSLALIDLDHFKRINDRHGHAAGDAVLRAFAAAAQSVLRGTDQLARWGGEEFLLLLDATGEKAAGIALERMQHAVAQAAVEVEGRALAFAFSAGLATRREGETAAMLLDRVDRALYRAKAAGRNQVVQA